VLHSLATLFTRMRTLGIADIFKQTDRETSNSPTLMLKHKSALDVSSRTVEV
jgi:hypothetical protein